MINIDNIIKKNTYTPYILIYTLLFTFFFQSGAYANIPTQPPVSIESDRAEVDSTKGIATYQGNVILKQGDKILYAEKLIIYRSKTQKNMEKVIAYGKPATFEGMLNQGEPSSKLPTTPKNIIQGEAEIITFYPQKNDLLLEGKAKLTQQSDTFTAPFITYNLNNKIIKSQSRSGERPMILLTPS